MNEFNIPATIIIGENASQKLAEEVERLNGHSVLLVTDNFLMSKGVADRIAAPLRKKGIQLTVFSNVQPEPLDRNVTDGLEALREAAADVVVGLGGGSPMDVAKIVALMAKHNRPLPEYKGYNRFERPGLPMIAIPTTAGTGSEVTKVVVITNEKTHEKMMLLDKHLMPAVALVDYTLSMTMPPSLTAHVGVDTLTHGIEAFVSKKAYPMTDPIAESCIRLCAQYLIRAYEDSDDEQARAVMMTAACQGGMAFANSSVCLVHGMSRPIGANFFVPHGQSNAVLLPEITRFSLPGALRKYARISHMVGAAGESDADETAGKKLVDYLCRLNETLRIGRVCDAVKVDRRSYEALLPQMSEAALASGSPQNNPIVPSLEEMIELYNRVW